MAARLCRAASGVIDELGLMWLRRTRRFEHNRPESTLRAFRRRVLVRRRLGRDGSLDHPSIGQAHLQRRLAPPGARLPASHDLDTNVDPVIDAFVVKGRVCAVESRDGAYPIPIAHHHQSRRGIEDCWAFEEAA